MVENLRVENNHSLFDWRRETKGILFFISVKPDFSRSFPFSYNWRAVYIVQVMVFWSALDSTASSQDVLATGLSV